MPGEIQPCHFCGKRLNAFNGQGYGEIRSRYQRGLTAVLAETDFHDNPATARWIIDNKDVIAAAYVKALVSTFGIAAKAKPEMPPAPQPAKQYYRVRKSWKNAASQLGAFLVLANAKALVDKNPGYSVFDETGKAIYTGKATPAYVRAGLENPE